MSCGMAAVPRLTSVGRELLILSRVWPKVLAPLPEPAAPASPLLHTLSILNIVSCFLDTETSFWITHLQFSNRPNWSFSDKNDTIRSPTFKSDENTDNRGQTRTAVFALLHLGRFDSLEVPCGLPLNEVQVVHLSCLLSIRPTTAIYFTECYLEPGGGHSIIYGFSWHTHLKITGKSGDTFYRWTLSNRAYLLNNRDKKYTHALQSRRKTTSLKVISWISLKIMALNDWFLYVHYSHYKGVITVSFVIKYLSSYIITTLITFTVFTGTSCSTLMQAAKKKNNIMVLIEG